MATHLLSAGSFECSHPDPEFFGSPSRLEAATSPCADTFLISLWQSYLEFMKAREHDSRSHLSSFTDVERLKQPSRCFCYQFFGCLYLQGAALAAASTDYPFRTDFPTFRSEPLTGKARLRALKLRMSSESYLKALLLTQGLNAMNSYSFSDHARKKTETIPGFGVFAESTIESGEWIGTVSGGQLVAPKELLETLSRPAQYCRLHPTLLYHPSLPLVLDARWTSAPCRWIRRSCHPNAEIKGVFVSSPSFNRRITEHLASPLVSARCDTSPSPTPSLSEPLEHTRPDFYFAIYATDVISKGFEVTLPFEAEPHSALFKYPCYCGLETDDCLAPNPFQGLSWSDLVFDVQASATAAGQAYEADPEARRLLLETLLVTLGPPSFPAYMTNTPAQVSSFASSLSSSTSDMSLHSSSAGDVTFAKSSSLNGQKASSLLFSSSASLATKKTAMAAPSSSTTTGAKSHWPLSGRLAGTKDALTKLKPLPLKAPLVAAIKKPTNDKSWKASSHAKARPGTASPPALSPLHSKARPDVEQSPEESVVEPVSKRSLGQLSREERKLQMYIESIERNEARERKRQQERQHRELHLQSAATSASSSTSSSPKRKRANAESAGPLQDHAPEPSDEPHGKSSEPDSSPIKVKSLLSNETLFELVEPSLEESAERIEILAEEPSSPRLNQASDEPELKLSTVLSADGAAKPEETSKSEPVVAEAEALVVRRETSPLTEDDLVDIE